VHGAYCLCVSTLVLSAYGQPKPALRSPCRARDRFSRKLTTGERVSIAFPCAYTLPEVFYVCRPRRREQRRVSACSLRELQTLSWELVVECYEYTQGHTRGCLLMARHARERKSSRRARNPMCSQS
jgi:hypothetical protein